MENLENQNRDNFSYEDLKSLLKQAHIDHESFISNTSQPEAKVFNSPAEELFFNLNNALNQMTTQVEMTKNSITTVKEMLQIDTNMVLETEKSLPVFEDGFDKIKYVLQNENGFDQLTPEFISKAVEFLNVAENILTQYYRASKRLIIE
ncbi:MAG: hypothetical protein SGJ04_03565 [Bacteroidota bacterium]|nr:hypothetical protein [Bacteroidota bacterium]